MKKIFFTTIIITVLWACDSKTNKQNDDTLPKSELNHQEGEHNHGDGHEHSSKAHSANEHSNEETKSVAQSNSTTSILDAYLGIKNALVKDDQDAASKAGAQLAKNTNSFDISRYTDENQKELKDILEVVKEHGEHIAKSEISHQREHFEMLGMDIKDLIVIAGADRILYQQYCPMYNDNQGGMWLSASNDVLNPLLGSKMPNCGKVQQEIAIK